MTTDQGSPHDGEAGAAVDPPRADGSVPTSRTRWSSGQLRIAGMLIVVVPDVLNGAIYGRFGLSDLLIVVIAALIGWFLPMLAAIILFALAGLWAVIFGFLSIFGWSWTASDVFQIFLFMAIALGGGLVFVRAARRNRQEARDASAA